MLPATRQAPNNAAAPNANASASTTCVRLRCCARMASIRCRASATREIEQRVERLLDRRALAADFVGHRDARSALDAENRRGVAAPRAEALLRVEAQFRHSLRQALILHVGEVGADRADIAVEPRLDRVGVDEMGHGDDFVQQIGRDFEIVIGLARDFAGADGARGDVGGLRVLFGAEPHFEATEQQAAERDENQRQEDLETDRHGRARSVREIGKRGFHLFGRQGVKEGEQVVRFAVAETERLE